jgi:hypothetical protein
LGGPVVDIPVILVEKKVILAELGGGHRWKIDGGEGGEEEVRFKDPPFSALV